MKFRPRLLIFLISSASRRRSFMQALEHLRIVEHQAVLIQRQVGREGAVRIFVAIELAVFEASIALSRCIRFERIEQPRAWL